MKSPEAVLLEHAPWCYEEAGLLEAVRLMAESQVRQVAVYSRENDLVGWYKLQNGRINFHPKGN
jgi:hypothetical protein